MDFHPDRLLPANASKPARITPWAAKSLVSVTLGYAFLVGLAALFEPSLAHKLFGALAAVVAAVIGHWLWKDKK